MFILDILDAATYRPTMPELAAVLAELLGTAAAADLPQPWYVTVNDNGSIGLQFPPEPDSVTAILSWASAFCAAVRSDPHQDGTAREIWAATEFSFDNAKIEAYAHIPARAEGPAGPVLQHADYPHEPGRLHGCPACEARCHCTPGDAECVFAGPHTMPPA